MKEYFKWLITRPFYIFGISVFIYGLRALVLGWDSLLSDPIIITILMLATMLGFIVLLFKSMADEYSKRNE